MMNRELAPLFHRPDIAAGISPPQSADRVRHDPGCIGSTGYRQSDPTPNIWSRGT